MNVRRRYVATMVRKSSDRYQLQDGETVHTIITIKPENNTLLMMSFYLMSYLMMITHVPNLNSYMRKSIMLNLMETHGIIKVVFLMI